MLANIFPSRGSVWEAHYSHVSVDRNRMQSVGGYVQSLIWTKRKENVMNNCALFTPHR